MARKPVWLIYGTATSLEGSFGSPSRRGGARRVRFFALRYTVRSRLLGRQYLRKCARVGAAYPADEPLALQRYARLDRSRGSADPSDDSAQNGDLPFAKLARKSLRRRYEAGYRNLGRPYV